MAQLAQRPDPTIDRFNEDPELSYTIPAPLYYDPAFLEHEKREIFCKSWIFVGHRSDLKNPGDYITAEFAGQRIFVIHSADGELKAFFNVCQHRGHSLLKGQGRAKTLIVCPYHAWSYDHDGGLVAAPNCAHIRDFNTSENGLPPVKLEDFCGFIFVNLDPDARPMAEIYPGAAEAFRRFRPGTENLAPDEPILFDIKGNWKNVGDNLLECYHCSPAHKDFVDLINMDTYVTETHEFWSIQYGNGRRQNSAYSYDDGNDNFFTLFLWPNVALIGLPGTEGASVFWFSPLAAELTHQKFIYYRPQDKLTNTEAAAMAYFRDVLGPEDVHLVEDVQVGLHSLGYHQGRIMVDAARSEISEHALHHFQHLVMRQMKAFV